MGVGGAGSETTHRSPRWDSLEPGVLRRTLRDEVVVTWNGYIIVSSASSPSQLAITRRIKSQGKYLLYGRYRHRFTRQVIGKVIRALITFLLRFSPCSKVQLRRLWTRLSRCKVNHLRCSCGSGRIGCSINLQCNVSGVVWDRNAGQMTAVSERDTISTPHSWMTASVTAFTGSIAVE